MQYIKQITAVVILYSIAVIALLSTTSFTSPSNNNRCVSGVCQVAGFHSPSRCIMKKNPKVQVQDLGFKIVRSFDTDDGYLFCCIKNKAKYVVYFIDVLDDESITIYKDEQWYDKEMSKQ